MTDSVVGARSTFTRDALSSEGFGGFVRFGDLRARIEDVSAQAGVYVVFRATGDDPIFLDANPGGRFKQRDPTVSASVLKAKWIEPSSVVYIGKGDNLRRRLKQYADFGAGKPIGHWGGRYVWQLADSADLLVAWMPCAADETAVAAEALLLRRFKAEYGGRLPFANIADPT